MAIFKSILAVVIGYVIFAVCSVLFFKLTKQPAHAEASTIFKIATLAYGIVISIIAGLVTRWIAGNFKANVALAGLMFALALTSMLMSAGDHWTQWFAMLFFAPSSLIGGYLKLTRTKV